MELLIKSSIIIAILYCFYKLFLARESFFAVNRMYLLSCLAFALMIPFLSLPKWHEQQGFVASIWENDATEEVIIADEGEEFFAMENGTDEDLITVDDAGVTCATAPAIIEEESTSSFQWLWYLYAFGAGLLLLNLLAQVVSVVVKASRNEDKLATDEGVIVNVEGKTEPCSFFKYIFINPALYDYETYDQILDHERIHVKQWHSVDLILAELAVALLWFNPFVWLLRKEIERNVEFQTDQLLVAENESQKENYQMNLVKIACHTAPLAITTNYNQSLIKSRILRMNGKKSNNFNYFKYGFAIPVLMILTMALNLPSQEIEAERDPSNILLISAFPPEIEEPKEELNPNCEEFERAVLDGDLERVRELLPTLDPACMGTNQPSESQEELEAEADRIDHLLEEMIADQEMPVDETSCDQIRGYLDSGNFAELRHALQFADLSCMQSASGGPSQDLPLMRGLMRYNADINIIGYRQFQISEIGFRIDVDDYHKGYCQDTNFIALAEAIIKKDEPLIRDLLLTREFACPLNTDGVSNDFPFIKKALSYPEADIVFHNNLGITVYSVGLAIDMRTDEDKQRRVNIDHSQSNFTCQDLIEALRVGDHSRAEQLLGLVDLDCYHRVTETTTTEGMTTTSSVVYTPLIIACKRGDVDLCRLLLAHGADPDYKGDGKATPLSYALESRNPDLVRLLVQYGAELKAEVHTTVTPRTMTRPTPNWNTHS
ncbi:ankyrin repeat domain-containing protein [Sanyastnella coralliicola]|uniref:ankyrin repeat domain-containing protein n=1 Tax=Sanyastnella coralliicola TaxID=3069118 RepID=UPI0027BAF424|nr:ankyrin repeat domain-containing protein [Longitalea sp. SCSIO 12813]